MYYTPYKVYTIYSIVYTRFYTDWPVCSIPLFLLLLSAWNDLFVLRSHHTQSCNEWRKSLFKQPLHNDFSTWFFNCCGQVVSFRVLKRKMFRTMRVFPKKWTKYREGSKNRRKCTKMSRRNTKHQKTSQKEMFKRTHTHMCLNMLF